MASDDTTTVNVIIGISDHAAGIQADRRPIPAHREFSGVFEEGPLAPRCPCPHCARR